MKIEIGSKVKYSREFLRSVGCIMDDMPFARGEVTELKVLSKDTTLAVIEWNCQGLPLRVNVKNLALAKDPERV